MTNLDAYWNTGPVIARNVTQLSKAVWLMSGFQVFGRPWPQYYVYKQMGNSAKILTQEQALQAIQLGLAKIPDNTIVFATTPTYLSQYMSACLLKQVGFQLVGQQCYRHPRYGQENLECAHPGSPDKYSHWEHIWWLKRGTPVEIGLPLVSTGWGSLANCGAYYAAADAGLAMLKGRMADYAKDLHVLWWPRGIVMPEGWTRFFAGVDFKLGHNFKLVGKAQVCPHNFDLKIFENWEPDFNKMPNGIS